MTGQWERLAKEVKRRREQLRLRQRDVELRGGPGPGTMRNIEQAARDSYAMRTIDSLERALEWPEGTVQKILDGTATEEELTARVSSTPAQAVREAVANLGFSAIATGEAYRPDAHVEHDRPPRYDGPPMPERGGDTPMGDDRSPFGGVPAERLAEMRFGPGERIPPRDATIVTVADLLARLRAERDRTPSMDDAEAALLRLLPELYNRDYPAIAEAQRRAIDEYERRQGGDE